MVMTATDARAEAGAWRERTRAELADGAAWDPYLSATGHERRLLPERLRLAGRDLEVVCRHAAMFRRWKAGAVLVDPLGRVLEINLADHAQRVERVCARDRLDGCVPDRSSALFGVT